MSKLMLCRTQRVNQVLFMTSFIFPGQVRELHFINRDLVCLKTITQVHLMVTLYLPLGYKTHSYTLKFFGLNPTRSRIIICLYNAVSKTGYMSWCCVTEYKQRFLDMSVRLLHFSEARMDMSTLIDTVIDNYWA